MRQSISHSTPPKPFRPARAIAPLVFLLLIAPRIFAVDYFEPPRALAEGIAPTFLQAGGAPLLFWQEASIQGDRGQVWIVCSRQEKGLWTTGRVAGPIDFRGSEPILYSAATQADGTVALAVAVSGTAIDIRLSHDGGMSFGQAATVRTEATAVGPRIFPSAQGGWMFFVTQPAQDSGGQVATSNTALNTNSLWVASSRDGLSWSATQPLIAEGEGLVNNYLATAASIGGRDVVVFQNQVIGEGDLASHYMLYAKTSADGGATWSAARAVTDYQEPVAGAAAGTAVGATAGPQYYDNQAAQLLSSGGKLYIAWQRRFTRNTQVRIVTALLDESGKIDAKSPFYLSSQQGSSILAQFIEDSGRPTVIYLDDRLAANEVWRRRLSQGNWSAPEALGLTALADPTRAGATAFASASILGGKLFALWQYGDTVGSRLAPVDRQRIFLLEPVLRIDSPRISIRNYAPGQRSRNDSILVDLAMPRSSAGIKGLAYVWKLAGAVAKADSIAMVLSAAASQAMTADEIWKSGKSLDGSPSSLTLSVPADGAWNLSLSLEDRAGNRSTPVSLGYYRDRTPPDPPLILPQDIDEKGFLPSNTFEIHWLSSEAEDLRGYSWSRLGPLDPMKVPASIRRSATTTLPGLSSEDIAVVEYYGLPKPPPDSMGTATSIAQTNIDNGWWLYSVSAIDKTGNVSDISTVLVRVDKQVPFTLVYDIKQTTDPIGRKSIEISGRGFLDEGVMARVVISKSRREPWDIVRDVSAGGFRVASNGLIDGIMIEEIPAGSYQVGLLHPKRGMYWAPNPLVFDLSGTLKYGVEFTYKPSWSLGANPTARFSIYDVIIAAAILFFGLGILLSLGQAASVWRDGVAVKLQVLALVNGGPMPHAIRDKVLKKKRRQGLGLRIKFTFFIAVLVLFVVGLVAVFLGASSIRTQSASLASGLRESASVLLESAAQGGRFFLDREGAVTQLGFLPAQTKALPGAEYITITGNSTDPKVAGRDVVYATNDPDAAKKIDSSRLDLGVSRMKVEGGEELASRVPAIALELEGKAREAIAGDLARKVELQKEKEGLPKGSTGDTDRLRINTSLDDIDRTIRDRLRSLSDEAVGAVPPFDANQLDPAVRSYLFFKPILEYQPGDDILYRGMVRLSASTALIVAAVAERTSALVVSTAEIAALVFLIGIIAAFLLSTSIVSPIRRVIAAIEKIRRTEDKADLADMPPVEVRTRDELSVLAAAANALSDELVDAAKQSKALIEGSDIQNHFIPLDKDENRRTLTISRRDTPIFELFGYYKGAKAVSGDFWDFQSLGNDGRYHYFIKCDVSGKDVSAAFIMVQVATMVINHFKEWDRIRKIPDFELAKLTYAINGFLVDRKYRGRFAAFTIGVISMTDGEMRICHAGDNMYRAWKASTGRTIAELYQPVEKGSPATGLIDTELLELKNSGFYTFRKRLDKGDVLLLYSDGMEDAIHRFRDAEGRVKKCSEIPDAGEEHLHHNAGEDNEHIGPQRVDAFIAAYDNRQVYHLHHDHESDRDLMMSFDFTKATGDLSERAIAYVAVGRVFCIHDYNAGPDDEILVDKRVDAFLERFLDQYELVFRNREAVEVKTGDKNPDGTERIVEDPNYVRFRGIRDEEQYDDLSIVAIRRK